MNKLQVSAIAAAIGLAFSTGAICASLTKAEYKAAKEGIEAEYKSGKASCDALAANARDICIAEAKGKEKVGKAELEERYKPSRVSHYHARVAKAEAAYEIAMEKCGDQAGNPKDVCIKEAKAAETTAKADAKLHMKTANANEVASEKTAELNVKAQKATSAARKDAAEDKIDAGYAVARAKCDSSTADAKDRCITEAKTRYGKS